MRSSEVPHRIPPLSWRKPSFLWTPLALALAIGWPAALFYQSAPLLRFILVAGAMVFALALITLGASWALGRAPRTRRTVVIHVLLAGALTAFAAPFVLTELLGAVANRAETFSAGMAMAMTPLALVIGLPVFLISGTLFAFAALARTKAPSALLEDDFARPHDVQPFR
jgi:hypothetical protein